VAGLIISGPAFASDGRTLAEKNNCTTCHAVDAKVVGPSFREIAARYRNEKGALVVLERKLRNGGGGVWGKMPMPATSNSVSDEELKNILQWILSLR
jgi:cytochrome c